MTWKGKGAWSVSGHSFPQKPLFEIGTHNTNVNSCILGYSPNSVVCIYILKMAPGAMSCFSVSITLKGIPDSRKVPPVANCGLIPECALSPWIQLLKHTSKREYGV